jgi:heptosyltransferase I
VVPVVRCIRERLPGTTITWVIGKLEHRLLGGLDGVEFIEFDKRGGWSAISALREQLRHRSFDVLLHMQVAARANLLSKLIRAPLRIGWDRARSRDFHHFFANRRVASVPFQHQVEAFLEFARALGLETGSPRWDLPIAPEAGQWVNDQIDTGRRTLLISPCSSHPLRNWRAEHYAAVADHAARELDMQVVISGGPSGLELEMGARIEKGMAQSCINLVGKDTLEQSKAMLRQADLVIAPDSGPAHIASAVGTPVIGLYAATWSRRSGPYNSLDLCVDRFAQAARRFRKKEPEEVRWGSRIEVEGVMDLIRVEDVVDKMEAWAEAFSRSG